MVILQKNIPFELSRMTLILGISTILLLLSLIINQQFNKKYRDSAPTPLFQSQINTIKTTSDIINLSTLPLINNGLSYSNLDINNSVSNSQTSTNSTQVSVNGSDIPVPENGSVNKVINTANGNVSVSVTNSQSSSSQNGSSTSNSSSSNLQINSSSSNETDGGN